MLPFFIDMKTLLFLIAVLSIAACTSTEKIISAPYEERTLDTIAVTASRKEVTLPVYNPSYHRKNDLIHTKLEVAFDWENQYLNGYAELTLQPIFYPTDKLRLDAKGFDIHSISVLGRDTEIPLKYIYNNRKDVFITLDKVYNMGDSFKIAIKYTAKPNELPLGGSAAITSDKGLYFINPLGEDPNKPRQIWTQGETESSSCWFPTIDRPNERCTQELAITIEDNFKTLSNGLLTKSTPNEDGTRTDYWVMDQPHAPYLFMMAIGEFAVAKDEWNGKLLEYYVEPEYAEHAENIYKNTKEMLTFFSELLGVQYPWQKYSQVVVRDYVSGAMENTTAVIFGDFIQMTTRELIDRSDLNESIVAHEMMHHWFGDLVTCESWANLPMNESFANYSEFLWFEHKYGPQAGQKVMRDAINGYMNQAVANKSMHPLIFFGYDDKEDMFDAHSYNKGGAILHMLRKYVGDEAFFKSLNVYLTDNKYNAAEAHHLRLAFEKVTGEDLNWFFNQWFFDKGHPTLQIDKVYDEEEQILNVTIEQTQDFSENPLFILPINMEIFESADREPIKERIMMTSQKQTFAFKVDRLPVWVGIDADRTILGVRKYKQTQEELMHQFLLSSNYNNKIEALKKLKGAQDDGAVRAIFEKALSDPFWSIRVNAIESIQIQENETALIDRIADMAKNDSRSSVRIAAVEKMGTFTNDKLAALASELIDNDPSYGVIGSSLNTLAEVDKSKALEKAESLMDMKNPTILVSLGDLFSDSDSEKYFAFYEKNINELQNYYLFNFVGLYTKYLMNFTPALIQKKMSKMAGMSRSKKVSLWGRYAVSNSMKKIRDNYKGEDGLDIKTIKTSLGMFENQDALGQALAEYRMEPNDNTAKALVDLIPEGKEGDAFKAQFKAYQQLEFYNYLDSQMMQTKAWETNPNLMRMYYSW